MLQNNCLTILCFRMTLQQVVKVGALRKFRDYTKLESCNCGNYDLVPFSYYVQVGMSLNVVLSSTGNLQNEYQISAIYTQSNRYRIIFSHI